MHDVAVIGFGPTGAVAASLLGQLGVTVLVVDRSKTVYDKPRAIALDHEIMRVFQQMGITDEIAPWVADYPPSEFHGVDGRIIKRLDAAPPPLPQGWPPNLSFTQPPVDAAMRACATRQKTVRVELGAELTAISQNDYAVSLTLESPAGTWVENARYVIACDGAGSTVRRATGVALEDLGFDEPWLVVDVKVMPDALDRLPKTNVQYCEPARPATYVVGANDHRRWEIMLHKNEDPREAADEANVWRLLGRWVSQSEAQIWRSASYRFHALIAEKWRDRRIFLAGDAAHQQPPFLGQGMCQGIRDVANLSWKMAWVLQGAASPALLDSYETERSPHVRQLTEIIKGLGRFVCERDEAKARARDHKLIEEMGASVQTTLRQDLMPKLGKGLLASAPHAANGTLFPQPRIAGTPSRLLDDIIGSGLRLVLSGALLDAALAFDQTLPIQVARVIAADDAPASNRLTLVESDGVLTAWFALHRCVAVLVRPDNYVFGVAADACGIRSLVSDLLMQCGAEHALPAGVA